MRLPELREAPPAQAPQLGHPELTGIGSYLPGEVVQNAVLAPPAGVDAAWFERRTGIRVRRHAPAGLGLVELAARAGAAALTDAALDPTAIDLVVVATISQERPVPNVAPQVAAALGASDAGAFDLGAACAGFVMAMATAATMVEARRARHVLVIAADILSRQTDFSDPQTAALFGDGAAAAVISASEGTRRWTIAIGADGTGADLVHSDPHSGKIRMQGHDTFVGAVTQMVSTTRAICTQAGVAIDEVDLFVFHQANGRITRAVSETLELDPTRVVDCIAELGNTSAASVPLALEHGLAQGLLAPGNTVLLCAFGAGLVWGGALIEWSKA